MRSVLSLLSVLGVAQVFAPLARLLGLYSIKEELEALSFKYSDPLAHQARPHCPDRQLS